MELVKADLLSSPVVGATMDMKRFTIKSRSPLIKPMMIPTTKAIIGRFVKLIPCTSGKNEDGTPKMGNLMEILPEGQQVGYALAITAVLRGALDISGTGDKATSPHLGKIVAIQRCEERIPSQKGQAAWNFIVGIDEKS